MKKFGLDYAISKWTSAATHVKIFKDEDGVNVDQCLYRSIISSLMYLHASCLDITFVVEICARYQANPINSHLLFAKRIVKYKMGLKIMVSSIPLIQIPHLWGIAERTGSVDDRKSTSGGCFFLGNNLISWFSKKHNNVSLWTTEAEYISAWSSCT